mgnify:CR=1 FL=1
MARPSPKEVFNTFRSIVHDELAAGRDVELPGLGTIHVEHGSSTIRDDEDAAMWAPPKRTITFTPQADSSSSS